MFTSLFVGRLKIKSGELKICQKNICQINQEILKASKTYHWKVEKLSKKYTYNYLRVFRKDFMRMDSKLDYLRLCVFKWSGEKLCSKSFTYNLRNAFIWTELQLDSHKTSSRFTLLPLLSFSKNKDKNQIFSKEHK